MCVLGLKDPVSKETLRLMEREKSLEKTLQAARIAETSKQHMRSLKEENSRVKNVDVLGRKGEKSQWETPCGNCGNCAIVWHMRSHCNLLFNRRGFSI